jgi:hypothetical protein
VGEWAEELGLDPIGPKDAAMGLRDGGPKVHEGGESSLTGFRQASTIYGTPPSKIRTRQLLPGPVPFI